MAHQKVLLTECVSCYSIVATLESSLAKTAAQYFALSSCYACLCQQVLRVPSDFHKQRICVKFCVILGKSFIETFEMLKTAFVNEALGWTQTYERWKCFKDGRTSTGNDPCSG
jgi:hypothetical protein